VSRFPELAGRLASASRRRRGAALALAIGVAAAGYASVGPGPARETLRVARVDLVLAVDVDGELAAVHSVDVGPPVVPEMWESKISFLVPEGAQVKKGDAVVGFDPTGLVKQLEQKGAEYDEAAKKIERKEIEWVTQRHDLDLQLAEAESRLEKARLKSAVPEELRARNDVRQTELDLEEATHAMENLNARIAALRHVQEASIRELASQRDRAKARVVELKAAEKAMTVRASQDGIIVYRTGRNNQKKKVGDSTWPLEKVLTLADLGEMRAMGEVDEADGGSIATGQRVVLHVEALPDHDVTGRIAKVARSVRRKSGRVPLPVFRVQIDLDHTDAALRPAMRFRGRIEIGAAKGVLAVARDAVFLRPSGPVVWARAWSGFVERKVTLGRRDLSQVEVVTGLEEKEEIATADLAPEVRP
jgi:multidrug efflux pump subunit AcrA (membrane-fusion protein)